MNRHQLRRAVSKAAFARILLVVAASLIADCGGDSVTTVTTVTAFTVGGTVSGLQGDGGLVLQNNGGDILAIPANGSFGFASSLPPGSSYAVTVKTQPSTPAQNCAVTEGSGTLASNVTSVKVTCSGIPVVTAIGTPMGTATTASIGPAGGSLSSSDSRFTLTVPAGVVANTTPFSIQPITNGAPGGVGSAYRLGPDGQTFAVPIELTWNYSARDLSGTAPEFLAVSYQDAQGHWLRNTNGTLDSAKGTLTITTDHFTDYATIVDFSVEPNDWTMKPSDLKFFDLWYCYVQVPLPELITPLVPPDPKEVGCYPFSPGVSSCSSSLHLQLSCPDSATWNVRLPAGGTGSAGTIVPKNPATGGAYYTAPATAPTPNKVLVGALVHTSSGVTPFTMPALVTIDENRYLGTFSVTVTGSTDFDLGGDRCIPNPVTSSASYSVSTEWDANSDLFAPGSYPVEVSEGSGTLALQIEGTTCTNSSGKVTVIPPFNETQGLPATSLAYTVTSDGANITIAGWTPPTIPGCSFAPPKFTITKVPATNKERIDGSGASTCTFGPATATGTYTLMLDQQ